MVGTFERIHRNKKQEKVLWNIIKLFDKSDTRSEVMSLPRAPSPPPGNGNAAAAAAAAPGSSTNNGGVNNNGGNGTDPPTPVAENWCYTQVRQFIYRKVF